MKLCGHKLKEFYFIVSVKGKEIQRGRALVVFCLLD